MSWAEIAVGVLLVPPAVDWWLARIGDYVELWMAWRQAK